MIDDLTIARITTIPKVKRKSRSLPRFVPVIFGNGVDDDTPGLQACVNNEAVQVDDQIHEPNNDVVIYGKHLVIRHQVTGSGGSRHIYITKCRLDCRF